MRQHFIAFLNAAQVIVQLVNNQQNVKVLLKVSQTTTTTLHYNYKLHYIGTRRCTNYSTVHCTKYNYKYRCNTPTLHELHYSNK